MKDEKGLHNAPVFLSLQPSSFIPAFPSLSLGRSARRFLRLLGGGLRGGEQHEAARPLARAAFEAD
jgi:hypothetical protein